MNSTPMKTIRHFFLTATSALFLKALAAALLVGAPPAFAALLAPAGVNADVYVADGTNNKIVRYTSAGTLVGDFATSANGVNGPSDLAFDAGGNLYVANNGNATIWKYAPDGTGSLFANVADGVWNIAFDAVGNLHVSNFGTAITKLSPSGTNLGNVDNFSGSHNSLGVAFDAAGTLWAGDNSAFSVNRFPPGQAATRYTQSVVNNPRGLAFDGAGNLFVANIGNTTISKYASTAGSLSTTGSVFATTSGFNPLSLAFDRDGNLYVAANNSGSVRKFSAAGAVLGTFVTVAGSTLVRGIAFAPSGHVTITNGTFDTPATGSFSATAPTGWALSGNGGVSSGSWSGSGFGVAGGSSGQFAYVQRFSGPSSISQNVTFPLAGSYQLSYSLAGRDLSSGGHGNCTYTTTISSSILSVGGSTTSNQPFAAQTHTFTVATAGTYTLAFTNTTASGDNTFYVDSVAITYLGLSATPPTVTTGSAASVVSTGATLNGTVNANGASTTVTFQYGTTTGYGSTATAAQSPISGSSNTAVSAAISGLAAHTQYHFRVVGVNSAGTSNGSNATFTTGNTNPTAPNAVTTGTTGDSKTVTVSFPATDADGDAVAITAATSGTGVTVNSFTGTSVTFTPASSFTGNGSFTYTVGDGFGGTATGTITVAVTDNDPPTPPVFTQYTSGFTASTSAYFVFGGGTDNVGPVTYVASLDGAAEAAVTSPRTFTGFTPGTHNFSLRTRDAAGNYSTPVTPTWWVQYPLTLTADNKTREYGAANPAFTGTLSGVQGSFPAVTPSWTTSAISTSAPGTYPLVGAISGADALRYYIRTNTTGTLTITQSAATSTSVADRSVVFSNSVQNVTLNATVSLPGSAPWPVSSVRFTTANDFPDRDPMTFTLEGTNGSTSTGPWTMITSGSTGLTTGRYTTGPVISFPNTTVYTSYRVLFPTIRNPNTPGLGGNSMQVAEVELLDADGRDVTTPLDIVVGTSRNSPFNEIPAYAVDNRISTKYLNFDKLNTGFILTPRVTSAVNGGTVTFQLKNGAANVGTAVISTVVAAGAAGVTYSLPAGTAAGTYTIQATYNGTSTLATSVGVGTLTVIPPPTVAALVVSGFPNPATAGTAGSFTVTAKDGTGATMPSYTGTVAFSSSDVTAALPTSYTFVPGDNGVKTFSATLRRAGTQTITVADGANAVTGTQSGIVVNAGVGSSGQLYTWGFNGNAQLGVGDTATRFTRTAVSGFGGATAAAAGLFVSVAVAPDGGVWSWGVGPVGDGSTSQSAIPVRVKGPGGMGNLSGITAVAAGGDHRIALKDDGTVWAWGSYSGDGKTATRLTPVQVQNLSGVIAIAAGDIHSMALKSDGTVWTWGSGTYGQLGNGLTAQKTTPVQVVGLGGSGSLTGITSIACGRYHSLARKNDGSVWAWGRNGSGQLGDGTTTQRTTPVQVSGLGGIASVAAGGEHSLALSSSGSVYTWGNNKFGQLGDGTTVQRLVPGLVANVGGAGTAVVGLIGGTYFSVARVSDGTLWAWGVKFGLGTGSQNASFTPVKVTGFASASILGMSGTGQHVLAVDGATTATQFLVTAPTGVAAGTPFDVAVRAVDAAGNSVAHVGTVRFTSNDALAGLPANYTFVAGDGGEKTFSVTLNTAGIRRVTVADATSKTLGGAVNVEVQAGGSTTITETVAAAFSAADQFVTVTARVTGNGTVSQGVVTFQMKTSGGADIGAPVFASVSNGVATASYVVPGGTPAAIYPIHASYSGGASFTASSGSGGNLRLGQAPTNMQTIASAATAPYSLASQSVTLSAAVISGAGTVNEGTISFRVLDSGGEVIESVTTSAPLTTGSGSVSYLLPPALDAGDYKIETSYSGGVNFEASANTATLSVTPAVSTVAATQAQADYSAAAQTVTLNATVTSAAGIVNEGVVEFQVKTTGGTNVGAAVTSEVVTDGEASVIYTLPAGTPEGGYTIAAHYLGEPNLADSTDETQTLTVLFLPETTITEVPAKTVDASATAQSVTLEATVSAQSSDPLNEGTVTFRVLYEGDEVGTPVTSGTVSGGAVSASYNLPAGAAPGDYTIEASYSGTANYVTSSALGALTVRGLPVVAVDGAGATPASLIFTMTGSLAGARYEHSATLLPDGQVLVAGGSNSSNLNTCEIYHPVTGTWSAAAAMAGAREGHAAILLATGKVLVVGGNNSGAALATAWLFDPAAGMWAATGSLATARVNPAVTLLANGKVLVTGGRNGPHFNSAELYDPATGTWSPAGTMGTARFQHSATLLADGRVLVAGGESATNAYLNLAELYDPTTNTWVPTGSFTGARREHAATRLSNGTVLIAGGYAGAGVLASCTLYDPATGTWSVTGSMNAGRSPQIQTLLPTGNVLVTSGSFNTAACEIYNAATGTWADAGALAETRRRHATLVLASGKVLVIGGDSLNGKRTSVELSNIPAVVFTAVEGSPGIRNGTFSDPDGNETVTLTASTGAITQDNAAGTWSWSPAAGFDGPSSQTVTITATDVTDITATASFTFTVTNVAPTLVITAPETALAGELVDFTFTATDPSAIDQAAGFMFAISYGDGSLQEPGATQLLPSPRLRGHIFASPGSFTVTCTATDKDGGVSLLASKMITILSPEIVLHNGSHSLAPELSDGQIMVVNFGSTAPNVASVRSFTVRNTGDAELAISSIAVPTGYRTNGTAAALASGASYTFQVALESATPDTYAGSITINSDDLDEASFDFPITGTVVAAGGAPVVMIGNEVTGPGGTGSAVLGGPPGSTLTSLIGSPALNSSGVLASAVQIRHADASLHTGMMVGQPMVLIASDTQTAPSLPGVNHFNFGPPVINETGHIAFIGEVRGVGITANVNSRCLFSNASDDTLKLVARAGTNVGLTSNLKTIGNFSIGGDLVIFLGTLVDNSVVLFGWDANTGIRALMRNGQSLDANGVTKTVKSFSVLENANASSGHGKDISVAPTGESLVSISVTFTDNSSGLVVGSFDGTSDTGFGATYGASQQFADTYASPAVIPQARWNTFRSPGFDNTGSYYGFISQMVNSVPAGVTSISNVGVFVDTAPGNLTLQLREDADAPGTAAGVKFADFSDLVLGGGDYEFLVKGELRGAGVVGNVNDKGLWAQHATNGLVLVAREGSEAPGVAGSTFFRLTQIALPGTAQPMFQASMTNGVGGVTAANDTGLWVINEANEVKLAVREGEVINVGGTNRTVTAITALLNGTTTGGALGRRVFLADGQLTLLLTFSGGIQANAKVVVP
jgi:alpha-tubulin suppressor-like RCC1 family protein